MTPEYQRQAHRLHQLRRSLAEQNSKQLSTVAVPSTWEIQSGETSSNSDQDVLSASTAVTKPNPGTDEQPLKDPLIYPDLYAPSGFDMLGILIRVRTRSNPVIDIGNVDSAVALVLCDNDASDMPIVYCSEPFKQLTGYTNAEILGRNCRFLQTPPKGVLSDGSARPLEKDTNVVARAELRDKIAKDEESQVQLVNYKKNGAPFVNLLTTIPISWDDEREKNRVRKRYVVGFQVDVSGGFEWR